MEAVAITEIAQVIGQGALLGPETVTFDYAEMSTDFQIRTLPPKLQCMAGGHPVHEKSCRPDNATSVRCDDTVANGLGQAEVVSRNHKKSFFFITYRRHRCLV
jgi:hypothetical protein